MKYNKRIAEESIEYRWQTTLREFSNGQLTGVEEVLLEIATGLTSPDDIADALGITKVRAESMLEDMIRYDSSRVAVTPVGRGIYLIEEGK